MGCSGNTWAVAVRADIANSAVISSNCCARRTRIPCISRKYNPRVWMLLVAALTGSVDFSTDARSAKVDVTDRQVQTIPLPQGKLVAIEVTIGNVRIEGWDRGDAEITVERRAPTPAQLARVPLTVEDTPARVTVRAVQSDNGTDP